jgi:hypothetical protein
MQHRPIRRTRRPLWGIAAIFGLAALLIVAMLIPPVAAADPSPDEEKPHSNRGRRHLVRPTSAAGSPAPACISCH